MQKNKIVSLIIVMALALVLVACKGKSPSGEDLSNDNASLDEVADNHETGSDQALDGLKSDDVRYGVFEEGIYRNPYFAFEVVLPKGWYNMTRDELEEMANLGAQEVQDTSLEVEVVNLFAVFKHPIESQQSVNANIIATAEKATQAMTIDSFMGEIVATYETIVAQVKVEKDPALIMLGQAEFEHRIIRMETGITTMRQDYYCAILEGYMVTIVVTNDNEESVKLTQ